MIKFLKIKKIKKIFVFVVFVFLFGSSSFFSVKAEDISDVQKDMKKVQNQLEETQKKLKESQNKFNINQTQINTTNNLLNKTKEEIRRKEIELENLDKRMELNKKILKNYIQEISFGNQDDDLISFVSLGILLSNFSEKDNQIVNIKEKVLGLMDEIKNNKNELNNIKEELDEKKEDHEKLLSIKQMEQKEITFEIQDAKTTLNQLNSKLDKLRSVYSQLLGKNISTKDVLEAAKFASKSTGISKSFLLGVLVQESNKGQNTGSCDYKQSKMSSKRLDIFKEICKDLGYDYKKQKVSCPPKNYKGTGGAMGVPQFMSDTWKAWEGRIANATGNKTPDPWNLVDGVTAMALKLSADGASKKTRFAEAKAYCVYLAGGNWGYYCFGSDKYKKSYEDVNCWGSSIRNYGEKVLCLKDNYEKYY